MKYSIIVSVLSLFYFSCSYTKENTVKNEIHQKAEHPNELAKQLSAPVSERDTITVDGYMIKVTPIKASQFPQNKILQFDTSETKNIGKDSARVKRLGGKLIFKISNAKREVILEDAPMSYESEFVEYSYLMNLESISQWLVYYQLYEGSGYLIVDQNSGETKHIFGIPSFSPDKTHFICGSSDLDAGYNDNGLQMFEADGGDVKLLWERNLKKWGANKVVWTKENEILVEQIVLDTAHHEQVKFARLTLEKRLR